MEQYRKLKIYVVMNDEGMLQQCIDVLRRFDDVSMVGFTLESQKALKRIGVLIPDLVLVEMFMPRLDGITLALQCQEKFGVDAPGFMFVYRVLPDTVHFLQQVHVASMHMFPVSNDLLEIQFRHAFLCQRSRQIENRNFLGQSFGFGEQQGQEMLVVDREVEPARYRKELCAFSEDRLLKIIDYELDCLGFRRTLLGYQYLTCALNMLFINNELENKMMKLYIRVARQYGVTWQSVEKNMRKAIDTAWKYGRDRVWESLYSGSVKRTGKSPSNSSFLYQLQQQIKRDYFW